MVLDFAFRRYNINPADELIGDIDDPNARLAVIVELALTAGAEEQRLEEKARKDAEIKANMQAQRR